MGALPLSILAGAELLELDGLELELGRDGLGLGRFGLGLNRIGLGLGRTGLGFGLTGLELNRPGLGLGFGLPWYTWFGFDLGNWVLFLTGSDF